jgi:hypothetical protein
MSRKVQRVGYPAQHFVGEGGRQIGTLRERVFELGPLAREFAHHPEGGVGNLRAFVGEQRADHVFLAEGDERFAQRLAHVRTPGDRHAMLDRSLARDIDEVAFLEHGRACEHGPRHLDFVDREKLHDRGRDAGILAEALGHEPAQRRLDFADDRAHKLDRHCADAMVARFKPDSGDEFREMFDRHAPLVRMVGGQPVGD